MPDLGSYLATDSFVIKRPVVMSVTVVVSAIDGASGCVSASGGVSASGAMQERDLIQQPTRTGAKIQLSLEVRASLQSLDFGFYIRKP